MSLYVCDKCGSVENTAFTNYNRDTLNAPTKPARCSACDPEIGAWHGAFPRRQWDGVIYPEGHARHVLNRTAARPAPTSGTCQYCGCHELAACAEGCGWANDEKTLCTACVWPEEVAKLFAVVHEKTHLQPHSSAPSALIAVSGACTALAWDDRPIAERQGYVLAVRVVFEMLREQFLDSIGDEAAAAAEELARLALYLETKHQDAIERAGDDATVVDVVLELLGEKRIVLASGDGL